jgi:DNA (cytosine-5)-methyltransferase 1
MWPTPRNNTGPSLDKKHLSLDGAVRLWPTPAADVTGGDNKTGTRHDRGMKLTTAAKLWPTPTKEGFDAGGHRGSADTLYSRVGGSLNPEWVEWLMGYPIGHTDSKDSATPSSRK